MTRAELCASAHAGLDAAYDAIKMLRRHDEMAYGRMLVSISQLHDWVSSIERRDVTEATTDRNQADGTKNDEDTDGEG